MCCTREAAPREEEGRWRQPWRGADSASAVGTSVLLVQASEEVSASLTDTVTGRWLLIGTCRISRGSRWGSWTAGSSRIGWLRPGFPGAPRPELPSRMWGCRQYELQDRLHNPFFPVDVLREVRVVPWKQFHKVSLLQDFTVSLIYQKLISQRGILFITNPVFEIITYKPSIWCCIHGDCFF